MDAIVNHIDPDTLRRIGLALFGERWQSALASALDVNRRTILRWLSGEWPVPVDKSAELRALLVARGGDIAALVERL